METRATLKTISKDWASGRVSATFEITEGNIEDIAKYQGTDLSLTVKPFRKHRSRDANALLWCCLQEIAEAIGADKWDLYLLMLKRYGKFDTIVVFPEAVKAIQAQWRESEVIGSTEIDGHEAVQMLCYYGSSQYDAKEFSHLLDGVISEMKECGLETPTSEEMQRTLAEWGKK